MIKLIYRLIVSSLLIIPLYFYWKNILSNNIQVAWFVSYYYLIIVLLISPITYIFYKIKKLKKYTNIIRLYKRPIWIVTWLLSFLHLIKFEENIYSMWEKFYSSKVSFLNFLIDSIINNNGSSILWMNYYSFWLWLIWFIIMMTLLITSNNISQRILWAKIWKNIQKLIYPLFIIGILHIYFMWWWKWVYLFPALILILSRSYVAFDKNFIYKWNSHTTISWYRQFLCLPCWYIYDEEYWDPDWWLLPWTKFEEIPDNRKCPVCWVTKKDFTPLDWHHNPEHIENHELNFKLKTKKYLTHDVIELIFYCKKDLEIIPGQFCNLIFKNNNIEVIRSYSIVKYIDNCIYFAIKLKKDWKWANNIKRLNIWDKIKVLWPFWDFTLKNTSNKKIFIATSTWLSPIYNMIEKSWNINKELYFWVQKEKDLFYLKELKKIPNLKINIFLSQEKKSKYNYWRINFKNIRFNNNYEIYMCWNPNLIESLNQEFKKSKKENIYFEKFI